MNLQNDYRVIYEHISDGKRAFYATKAPKCDPTVDEKIVEATIGEYKLIYEKDGQIYGSVTGIPAEGDHCFAEFDKVFKEAVEEPVTPVSEEPTNNEPAAEEPAQTYTRRARKPATVEEPVVVEENNEAE
jgi:hypothetical protein